MDFCFVAMIQVSQNRVVGAKRQSNFGCRGVNGRVGALRRLPRLRDSAASLPIVVSG